MSASLDAADPYYSDSVLSIPDASEAAQMAPFQPGTANGTPWWQSVVMYGASRAIDNRFGPTNVQGNTQAGSFQGAGGRTVMNSGSAQAGALGGLLPGGSGGLLLLVAVAAVAYVALKG